ncbi:hypothetical protein QEN19_001567 [Hanseniaspora menglaensis]
MSMKLPGNPNAGLFKQGYNSYSNTLDGQIFRSIEAIKELHKLCVTSYGPYGRNKIIVNNLGKTIITNDAATMLRELDVIHPAVKILIMATQQQQQEMGDCSNFVMVLAGELLNCCEKLLTLGLQPVEIIQGFNMAKEFTLKELDLISNEIVDGEANQFVTSKFDPAMIEKVVKPILASKKYGLEDSLSKLISEAVTHILPTPADESLLTQDIQVPFNVDSIRIVKIMGGSLDDSKVVKGMLFPMEPVSHLKNADMAKVVVFNCPVDIATTETKGTVLLHNAKEMLDFSKGEEDQLDEMIREIAEAGIKVVICGATVSDLALHYLNRYNLVVMKIGSKFELRRLCKVCGATPLARLGKPTAEEVGFIETVKLSEIGSNIVTVFKQESFERTQCATIVLRGATKNNLDDVERCLNDGISGVKGLMKFEGSRVVPGAGSTEIELVSRITKYGEKTPGLLQLSIKQFAKAFEVIPRILAETAGLNCNEVLPNLYAAHNNNQSDGIFYGIDVDGVEEDGVKNIKEEAIFDLLTAKKFAINVATDAATTVLSVDQIIMAKRAGGPAVPKGPKAGNWDQDD